VRRVLLSVVLILAGLNASAQTVSNHTNRIALSFGHKAVQALEAGVRLSGNHAEVGDVRLLETEPNDALAGEIARVHFGAGDVDRLECQLTWKTPSAPARSIHSIWQYLLDHGEPGQSARLKDDPGLRPDAPLLTVMLSEDGTRGFTVGLEQLLRHRALWVPEHDCFITLADAPVEFAAHLASLKGERVLDRVRREPEASLEAWKARWADFGNPTLSNAAHPTDLLGIKGHITGFTPRPGSIHKFAVDPWGSARPDLFFAHKFRFDLVWPGHEWRSQRIVDGLPVLETHLARSGQSVNIEQFVEPLRDEPPKQPGDIPGALFTRVRFSGAPGPIGFQVRLATENTNRHIELRQSEGRWVVTDRETGSIWLMVEPTAGMSVKAGAPVADSKNVRLEVGLSGNIAPGVTPEVVLKLPSPALPGSDLPVLASLKYDAARAGTVRYWEGWLSRGARFEVPEPAVNDLFRASLWHALMLPRYRPGAGGHKHIDLPYSNFAYGQTNSDWPINQGVYVDYMLHGLRGYFDVATEEFAAMYATQQKPDGRVGGYAEWSIYTPGMLYSIARNYLLSGDRTTFDPLLPASLKALDYCLAELAKGRNDPAAPGLIVGPLNDLTHAQRAWGTPNAYYVAAFEVFGQALARAGHARAADVSRTAARMREDVTREFARASVRSPLVQLTDCTWINYVPCDATTPRRLLDEWYPTDIDLGALHLARLGAIDPRGSLATALLHDHEDNLFFGQLGAANEPVYNQQATAYLYRDEPEAAIRAFYSMMACAFSHGQLTPLEHRWAWGQYYMPPSTDGAWFELYRNLLVNELAGEETLFVGQATPRAWLADGRTIRVAKAPTHFGPVNLSWDSSASTGELKARVEFLGPQRPKTLLVRLRHPEKKQLRAVRINGADWSQIDPTREVIRIVAPTSGTYEISARY
jgi:hypothetical protein